MNITITHISDTHDNHRSITIEKSDILIVTGDYSRRNTEKELHDFMTWLNLQPVKKTILISGNHDRFVNRHRDRFIDIVQSNGIIYLENSSAVIDKINFWGSPIVVPIDGESNLKPHLDEGERQKIWDTIPSDTDIVITHTPPFGILDSAHDTHFGCKALLTTIFKIKPKYHLFGHVHQCYGVTELNGIKFMNGSVAANDALDPNNNPMKFFYDQSML